MKKIGFLWRHKNEPQREWRFCDDLKQAEDSHLLINTDIKFVFEDAIKDRESIVSDIMRDIDAYAYDYQKEGKFAKSRFVVETSLKTSIISKP